MRATFSVAMWLRAPILRTNRIKRGIEKNQSQVAAAIGTVEPEVGNIRVVTTEEEAREGAIMEEAAEAEILEAVTMAAGITVVEAVEAGTEATNRHPLSRRSLFWLTRKVAQGEFLRIQTRCSTFSLLQKIG
jgi:hypothetical protein